MRTGRCSVHFAPIWRRNTEKSCWRDGKRRCGARLDGRNKKINKKFPLWRKESIMFCVLSALFEIKLMQLKCIDTNKKI